MKKISHYVPLLFLSMLLFTATAHAEERVHRIQASGVGTVFSAPDIARISIGVANLDLDGGKAMARSTEEMNAIIDSLKKAGVEARYIQTRDVSLNLRYKYINQEREFLGYEASTSIQVEFDDFQFMSETIPVLVELGADNLSQMQFDVRDKSAMLSEARALAYKDARSKAEQLSDVSGIPLGKTLVISVEDERDIAPMMFAASEARDGGAPMPIEGGQISVTARVMLEVELVE